MSIAMRRVRPGAPARTIRCSARSLATSPTIRCARRSRPATARCRCCSPTGTAPARPRYASPTIANITAAAKSRCGASMPGATPRLYGPADGWRHVTIFGMGIAEGDIDGSGYPQYALTSMGDIKLQKLDRDESDGRTPGLSRHRWRCRRDSAFPLYWRRQTALDELARGICRLQQLEPARSLHLQGQSLANARLRLLRSQQPAARPVERQVCRSGRPSRASRSTGSGAAR